MKRIFLKNIFVVGVLMVANFISAQGLKTEDDIVHYLDNATNLDLIEGIYYYRSNGNDVWNAVVFDLTSGDFVFYKINSRSRELEPYSGKYETHLVRTTKYAYTYYAYVIINGRKYDSSTTSTFDSQHTSYHWCCVAPIDGNWHVTLNLKNKVYPN